MVTQNRQIFARRRACIWRTDRKIAGDMNLGDVVSCFSHGPACPTSSLPRSSREAARVPEARSMHHFRYYYQTFDYSTQ